MISGLKRGTRFDLYFPLTREHPAPDKGAADPAKYKGRGESILIVDDIKSQRQIASHLLSKLKYEVFAVSSGEKAVEFLKTNAVDLIILDMIMDHGIDGSETYRRIRQINPVSKVIIASGFAETRRVSEAQKLGAGQFIRKPYTVEQLGMAVRNAMAGI